MSKLMNSRFTILELPKAKGIKFARVNGCSLYAVDSDGNVWSSYNGSWKKRSLGNFEYFQVTLVTDEGRQIRRYVHHLILESFVSKKPNEMVARHYPDRNTRNNRLSNLAWGTPLENTHDSIEHGTKVPFPLINGERNHFSKLTEERVRSIYKSAQVMSFSKAARRHRVSISTVGKIVNGNAWKHLNLKALSFHDRLSSSRCRHPNMNKRNVKSVIKLRSSGRTLMSLAKEFSVSYSVIRNVLSGKYSKVENDEA